MSNVFFSRFHPRVVDVVLRDRNFWTQRGNLQQTVKFESTAVRNFMFVIDGDGVLSVNGTEYPLHVGTVYYFPLRSRIQLSYTSKKPMRFYSIHYVYKLIIWDGVTAVCQDPQENSMPLPIVTHMPDAESLLLKFKNLYDLWQEKKADYEWHARLHFLNIINEVWRVNSERSEGDPVRRAISRSIDYIKQHYSEPLEREKLADKAAMSRSYFSVMFKKVTGFTPTQYITRVRLDAAKKLLLNSDMTVAEVAREVGFQDPLYFARVFSNYAGMPPREYRKA
jgi:AraC-like DNA-binding protein